MNTIADHAAEAPDEHSPFWSDPRWADGRVHSTAQQELLGLWLGVLVFAGFSGPLVWIVLPRELAAGHTVFWLVLLMPLFALLLLFKAGAATWAWRRFGNLELVMDPFPGSIGGQVGGSVELPLRGLWQPEFKVALVCMQIRRVQRQGRSKTSEALAWKNQCRPLTEPSAVGTRLRFTFDVPAELPPSAPAATGEPGHRWKLRISGRLPGADLDRSFEIPVARLDPVRKARQPAQLTPAAASPTDVPASTCRIERTPAGLELSYPASRQRSTALILTLIGSLFAGAGVLAAMLANVFFDGSGFGWAVGVMIAPVVIILGLVGLLIFLLGLYELGNTLQVTISSAEICVTRRWFGIPSASRIDLADIERIDMWIDGAVGSGAAARESYAIRAFRGNGRGLPLGDGIRGRRTAEAIAKSIEAATHQTIQLVARKRLLSRKKSRPA